MLSYVRQILSIIGGVRMNEYLTTKSGRNMYDMLSMLQKAVRRADYENAGYAANELEQKFRGVLWSRMLVISAEDCYGILTKELIELKKKDDECKSPKHIARAVALMCKAKKSRDACYFSCNFVLDSRNPRSIVVSSAEVEDMKARLRMKGYDGCGFEQISLFEVPKQDEDEEKIKEAVRLEKAIHHFDMDMIGYQIDMFRGKDRKFLWSVLKAIAMKYTGFLNPEIESLEKADEFVNKNKKVKDEIFISKAVMNICYAIDPEMGVVESSEIINADYPIDWTEFNIKPIDECVVKRIPDWVYDCHTWKGKKAGKTDWDMTRDEQEALKEKQIAYFDEASWIYTYEQDFRNGTITEEGIRPIREYAETHEANPVKFIPYE